MAAPSTFPSYTSSFFSDEAQTTAAKTTHADLANAVLLFTAGANGSRVRRITATPQASCSQMAFFVYKSKDGTKAYPVASALLAGAVTVDATHALQVTDLGPTPDRDMQFGPGEECWVAQSVASAGVAWAAERSDF